MSVLGGWDRDARPEGFDRRSARRPVRRLHVFGFAALTVLLLSAWLGVASASAVAPWWQVTSSTRPTNLWAAKAEVQEIQAEKSSSGVFVAGVAVAGRTVACLGGNGFCSSEFALPGTETAVQLQAALEGANGYGAGEVTVEGGPVGRRPFTITSTDAARYVSPLELNVEQGSGQAKVVTQGGSGRLALTVTNLGDAPARGAESPIRIIDTLPAGVTVLHVEGQAGEEGRYGTVPCTIEAGGVVSCAFGGVLPVYESIEVELQVALNASAPVAGVEAGTVTVGGGGAAAATSQAQRVDVSEAPAPFGVESYSLHAEEEGGAPDVQAGSHPFQLTTSITLNQGEVYLDSAQGRKAERQPALPRNFRFRLPAGLVGNATAMAQCSELQFATISEGRNTCPADTAIGVAAVTIIELSNIGLTTVAVPLFNLAPEKGEPARFGFTVLGVPVVLRTGVRTGEEYGVTVSSENTTEAAALLASQVTFWGVPGDPRHDDARGWGCVYFNPPAGGCSRPEDLQEKPFLRMPTSCGETLDTPMELEPWNVPLGSDIVGEPDSHSEGVIGGCGHVPFTPRIEVAPDVQSGATPTGLTVHVRVPNETVLTPSGISEGDVRNTTVVLPRGVSLNPGGADGLEGCSEAQIGFTGVAPSGMNQFTPGPAQCPDAAKIATVEITSPLLPATQPLTGAVYLASPAPNGEAGENPLDSLIGLYIVAEDPLSGTLVKLAGKVEPDALTGRLTAVSEEIPQLPFEDLELHFFGGSQAPLATPVRCGSYTTSALFEPWSGTAGVASSSAFEITSGPNGGPCVPGGGLFAPEFNAESINTQAGAFSELRTTMGHPDANQPLGGLQIKLPPGLSGMLSSVKLCEEPQAAQGTCGPESLIGHTIVTAGYGSDPVVVKRPGNVYITGPYDGAPFGLSIANPAEAGPFDLEKGTPCDCVVVRARIEVNPQTAALTVTSGPLPTIIKGIPLDLQHVQVAIDRPGFTFNPTNCDPLKIEGAMSSSEGASAPVATPFQVTDCAALKFEPKFSVSTRGRTSRLDGASLTVHLAEPANAVGTQANIRQVKVELPVELPSNLPTLQKACTAAQFHANPAGCPVASVVGHAVVHTPLLPVPLEGPAYFVSNGGEEFPNLIMVLQGEGVTVQLVGDTFISETGITSSTFKTVPDVPFSTFELTLPEGPHSALAANTNLCDPTKTVTVRKKVAVKTRHGQRTVTRKVEKSERASLVMPVEMQAQSGGAPIRVNEAVNVSECPKHAVKARAQGKGRGRGLGKRKKVKARKQSKRSQK